MALTGPAITTVPLAGTIHFASSQCLARALQCNNKQDNPFCGDARALCENILAEDDSYAENAMRERLAPLDQFRAMLAIVEKGDEVEVIGVHHFTTPAIVRQRLKFPSVSPALLDI